MFPKKRIAVALLLLSLFSGGEVVAADAKKGEEIYGRCLACHALAYDRVGPHHCGLIGRKAGSVPGFNYSPAMKRSGLTWNEKTLDRFLKNPPATVPGTTMTYAGIPDAKERADLIAYLKSVNQSGACPRPASR